MTAAETERKPAMPCPADQRHGIGNDPRRCAVCNRFNQAVRRHALRTFGERWPDAAAQLRAEAKAALYPAYAAKEESR